MTTKTNINNFSKTLIIYLILLLGFISVFNNLFSRAFNSDIFKYADEVIFALNLLVLGSLYAFAKKLKLIHILILLFIVYSIAISFLFGYNKKIIDVVFQTLINIKFFIFLLAFILLFKKRFSFLEIFFKYIIVLSFAGVVLHVVFGESFNELLGVSTFARPNIRYIGFLPHPNHLAYLMVLYVGLILNECKIIGKQIGFKNWIKIFMAIAVIFLADSRTAMIAVLIFFLGFYWKFILRNHKIFSGAILAVVFIFIGLYFYTDILDTISKNIQQSLDLKSTYIRGNMIYLSGLILYQFFPIGTGAATFGSILANDKVYALYDQAERYYFVNEIGVYDSNIASIIGEYGLIGILLYILIFRTLKKHLLNLSLHKNTMINSLIFVFLFFSITNPMLTNNVYILLSVPVFMKFVLTEKPAN